MSERDRGAIPVPDYERIHQADEPRLFGPVPALMEAVENANLVANREILTLSRAGSNPRNPILSGLGVRLTLGIGTTDSLLGLWLFQRRRELGANLVLEALPGAPGQRTFDFLAGSGQTVAGDHLIGAKKNYIRWATAFGTEERQLWIKDYDADVVALEGHPALDPVTLDPVEVVVQMLDETRPWRDVVADFFVSWSDEFQKVHVGENQYLNPGFRKAYGGALVVSVFETGMEEGEGTEVNPFTDAPISDQHTVQVENVPGLKHLTFRFRSKAGSLFFRDVEALVLVVEPEECSCVMPGVEPCTAVLLKHGTETTEGAPSSPSIVDVPTEPAEVGTLLLQDLLVITIRGATKGVFPKVRVTLWRLQAAAQALSGARLVQFGSAVDYTPYIQTATGPVLGDPYRAPERYTIALSRTQLIADQIAQVIVQVKDGEDLSDPVPIVGETFRDVLTYPAGGTGGGIICAY